MRKSKNYPKYSLFKGEEIFFQEVISTATARGQVEKWLLDLENKMKKTMLLEIQTAQDKYEGSSFNEWLQAHPGQCVWKRVSNR